jgi:hypothetical protein
MRKRKEECYDSNHVFYGIGIDGKINETIKYRVEFESMSLGGPVAV